MYIEYGDCRVGKAYAIILVFNNERLTYAYYPTEERAVEELTKLVEKAND